MEINKYRVDAYHGTRRFSDPEREITGWFLRIYLNGNLSFHPVKQYANGHAASRAGERYCKQHIKRCCEYPPGTNPEDVPWEAEHPKRQFTEVGEPVLTDPQPTD